MRRRTIYYFGIENAILKHADHIKLKDQSDILSISVRLPLCKSSGTQLWPILFIINQSTWKQSIVAGIFRGESKPSCINDFLNSFVEEVMHL